MNEYMKLALEKAREGMNSGVGGPFGAAVVKDGEVLAVACNEVLKSHDPTSHAEINAIRQASRRLGTHDLSGCELYATGYPCPMCLSAIIWANIKSCYFALDTDEAERIGFRDEPIYRHIRGEQELLSLTRMDHDECRALYAEYAEKDGVIY